MNNKLYEFWKPVKRIERSYSRTLKTVTKLMVNAIGDVKDPNRIVSILKSLSRQKAFQKHCESLALRMVTQLYKKNDIGWKQAALESSTGKEIYSAIMKELKSGMIGSIINEQVAYNAAMIKTLPINVAVEFTDYIQSQTYEGSRASDISDDLRHRITNKSKANIDLIARTEVSKTQCALTQARAENLGLDWYIWRTSKDSRVRSSHDIMDGVLVRWSDPPNPEKLSKEKRYYGKYHAGSTFNCRCYPEPVVDLEYVKFPCKVYHQNKITTMTKTEFMTKTA